MVVRCALGFGPRAELGRRVEVLVLFTGVPLAEGAVRCPRLVLGPAVAAQAPRHRRASVRAARWSARSLSPRAQITPAVLQGRHVSVWRSTRLYVSSMALSSEWWAAVPYATSSAPHAGAHTPGPVTRSRGSFRADHHSPGPIGGIGAIGQLILPVSLSGLRRPSVARMDWKPEIPRWRQVYALLEERIDNGVYPPGTRLPSVLDLQTETGISPVTARRVLQELRAAGLAYMEPGIGTFVAKLPEPGAS